ncbi:hypothetical protein BDAP_001172 [Binucleata daphniae]
MQVIIESTNLKQKGFISFFKTKKFEITFYENSSTESLIPPLILKAKVAFAGFIVKLSNADRLTVKIRVDENVTEHEIFVKEGKVDIRINNSKFKGVITLNITNEPVFDMLENMHRQKKGFDPFVGNFTVCTEQTNNKISLKQTYDKKCYFVDLVSYNSTWQKEFIKNNNPLPKGWERRYTFNNKVYYINHNKNITQWESPDSKTYITELENKILKYRLINEETNIVQFFDFSKFRIIVNRKFMVQSTASIFLRARREHLLRQPFVVFYGEIGEDYGGLVKEFFYDASLEIAKDERIKCLGNVFDVCSKEERNEMNKDSAVANNVKINNEDEGNYTKVDKDESKRNSNIVINDSNDTNNGTDNILNSGEHVMDTPVHDNLADMSLQTNENSIAFDTNQIEATFLPSANEVPDQVYICNSQDYMNDPWFCENNYGKNKMNDKDFFVYLGIFLGLALEHEMNIAMDFSLVFFENLLLQNFDISHIQDVEFQANLLFILKNNVNSLEMMDMEGELLTENNKVEYVNKNIRYYLYKSKKEEYEWIREGFYRVAIKQVVNIFTAHDLARMFTGKEDLTYEILQNSVLYLNCNENTKEVKQLWNILQRKDEHFYRKFLHFITGSASIPITGLKINKYKWFVELLNEHDVLVRASSCLNKLFIGKYETESIFEQKLIFSIENTEGFHKV